MRETIINDIAYENDDIKFGSNDNKDLLNGF